MPLVAIIGGGKAGINTPEASEERGQASTNSLSIEWPVVLASAFFVHSPLLVRSFRSFPTDRTL
ncbi:MULTISPECIES: hypothetical protein [Oceanobacillus]|uniref:hypothetical protein n=1 Tax=Oceanobacillus TaxID=182709 RepID=UPI0011157279|nr:MULTISPECIES: hypothetical protein [Oceanobacillus]